MSRRPRTSGPTPSQVKRELDWMRAASGDSVAVERLGKGRGKGRGRSSVLRREEPSEAQVQGTVLTYLALDPAVAWVHRTNSGAATDADGRFIRFVHSLTGRGAVTWFGARKVMGGYGFPDLDGQMADGKRLSVECKSPGGWRQESWFLEHLGTPDHLLSQAQSRLVQQYRFLSMVRASGGVAFACDSADPQRIAELMRQDEPIGRG